MPWQRLRERGVRHQPANGFDDVVPKGCWSVVHLCHDLVAPINDGDEILQVVTGVVVTAAPVGEGDVLCRQKCDR